MGTSKTGTKDLSSIFSSSSSSSSGIYLLGLENYLPEALIYLPWALG
jgi:hypothetical protein